MITNDIPPESGLEWGLFRETIAQLSEGVSVFDSDFRLVMCNEMAVSQSGIPPDLLLPGVHLRDLLIAQAQLGQFGACDPIEEANRRIEESTKNPRATCERRLADGRILEARRSSLPGGAFLILCMDITAIRRAEEESRVYRFVANSCNDIVSVLDAGGKYVFVNDEFCRASGWNRNDVIGKAHGVVVPAAMTAERRKALLRCIQSKTPQRVDAVVQLAGAGTRSISTTYYPHPSGGGAVTFVVQVSRDDTRRIADALRAEADASFIRLIADNIPGMVGYWNKELRCEFANSQYMTWFGRTSAQMSDIHIRDLMGEEVYRKNEAHIHGALAGQDQEFERSLVKPSGEVGHTLTRYIVDRAGDEVRGFFVLASDITDVNRRAKEREVAHVALRNALVREVNHRIKNSLQGVTGLLARHGYANPDMMPVLNQAITQILSVATIHGLQGQSGSRDLNLLELIESIAQHIRQIWDHSVTVDCLAGLRNWHINPKEAVPVALILNELLANAAKHVDPRAPGLSVHGALDRDRKTLRISIANRVRDGARFNDAAGCGVGLQLVDSLLPRVGATLKAGLVGQQFEAVLELGAPVVSEQTSH